VQLKHQLNQRALERCAPVGVEGKTASGKPGRASEINELQLFANLDVRLRLERKRGLFPVDVHDRIVLGGFAHRDRLMRQVRQTQHHAVSRRLRFGRLFVQLRNAVSQVARLLLLHLGLRSFFLSHERANLLGRTPEL